MSFKFKALTEKRLQRDRAAIEYSVRLGLAEPIALERFDAQVASLRSGRRPNVEAFTVLQETCPCDDCPHRARCAESGEACEQFSLFIAGAGERRWAEAPRQPSQIIGKRLSVRGPADET